MADLPEADVFDDGVYQIETTDPVQGGADGINNRAARSLANRTRYLVNRVLEGVGGAPLSITSIPEDSELKIATIKAVFDLLERVLLNDEATTWNDGGSSFRIRTQGGAPALEAGNPNEDGPVAMILSGLNGADLPFLNARTPNFRLDNIMRMDLNGFYVGTINAASDTTFGAQLFASSVSGGVIVQAPAAAAASVPLLRLLRGQTEIMRVEAGGAATINGSAVWTAAANGLLGASTDRGHPVMVRNISGTNYGYLATAPGSALQPAQADGAVTGSALTGSFRVQSALNAGGVGWAVRL